MDELYPKKKQVCFGRFDYQYYSIRSTAALKCDTQKTAKSIKIQTQKKIIMNSIDIRVNTNTKTSTKGRVSVFSNKNERKKN